MFFAALTPLLPHYVHEFHLGKAGAGVLQAMYPAGALVAGIPGGIAAARLGVKPTVLIGLSLLALTTVAFGLADSVWTLDLARFLQGVSSAFSWTGALAWLVAAAPPGRRGQLIGSAFGGRAEPRSARPSQARSSDPCSARSPPSRERRRRLAPSRSWRSFLPPLRRPHRPPRRHGHNRCGWFSTRSVSGGFRSRYGSASFPRSSSVRSRCSRRCAYRTSVGVRPLSARRISSPRRSRRAG